MLGQALADELQAGSLLAVSHEHGRLLVDHFATGKAADAPEGFVNLHDVAGQVGHHNRRGRVFEHRGRHAQLFLGTALLADVAPHAEQAEQALLFVPEQADPQLDGNLLAIGTQAVEDEHLGIETRPPGLQARRLSLQLANLGKQREQRLQLRRHGDQAVETMCQQPIAIVAKEFFCRRADVVQAQVTVGGDDHIAGAFRQ